MTGKRRDELCKNVPEPLGCEIVRSAAAERLLAGIEACEPVKTQPIHIEDRFESMRMYGLIRRVGNRDAAGGS